MNIECTLVSTAGQVMYTKYQIVELAKGSLPMRLIAAVTTRSRVKLMQHGSTARNAV